MKKSLAVASLVALTVVVSGCGSSPDSLVEDQIDDMNELAEAMEEDAPKSELDEISERIKKRGEKLEELDLSDEEKKRLEKKYEDELAEATGRLMKAMMGKAGRQLGKQFSGMPSFGN